ncbi:right-handed parallel beta-helix repeat-containing protein [Wenyingzhuangia sp. IMCC45467]
MKKSNFIYFFTLSILFCIWSCASTSLESEIVLDKETHNNSSIPTTALATTGNTYNITAGMSFAQINTVLDSMVSGDVVKIEEGTYYITGKLNFKNGISVHKKNATTPIFDAQTSSPSEMLQQYWTWNNNDVDFYGIQFRNIRFNIQNANNTKFRYCIFDYGIRKTGTDKTYTADAYLNFVNCTDILTIGNVFKRRSGKSGRGIYTSNCENTKILNNTFGDGGTTGYFVCAINDNSNNTLIDGNIINRNSSWVNLNETDHGIYAHSFNVLTISNNTISGWPANSSGGAIKARNGQNLNITNNTMNTSGILLYVYSNSPANPFLNNVIIEDNTINVASSDDDIYHGIGYWRNTSDTTFSEYSIRIANNELPNGRIKIGTPVVASDFNANNGGIFNNNINAITLPTGINNSGNY